MAIGNEGGLLKMLSRIVSKKEEKKGPSREQQLEAEIVRLKTDLKNLQVWVSVDSHPADATRIEDLERMIAEAEAEKRQLEVSGDTVFKV